MALLPGPNQRSSLDYVSDTLISGQRIRILAVVGDFTRECLALVVGTSYQARASLVSSTPSSRSEAYRR